ncbi:MAG: hypothetical protein ABIT69_08470 [Sphingomicrobium sp.]
MAGVLALVGLFFATMPMARRRHAHLAQKRKRLDSGAFILAMGSAAVSSTTAQFLWKQLQPFYYVPLGPHPDDRLESLIAVDRPEIDGLINRFWTTMRGGDPFPQRAPLEHDPTVAELGRHLDRLAGWTVLRAA